MTFIYIATCIHQNITKYTVLNSYRNCETDFSKEFFQGIILAWVSQPNDSSLLKRYIQVPSNVTQNSNIIISFADKSGGVVIMHKRKYIDKINSLLEVKYL